jgi:hypothetical protein
MTKQTFFSTLFEFKIKSPSEQPVRGRLLHFLIRKTMQNRFLNRLFTSLLLGIALIISVPVSADHTHPAPSKKEVRREARSMKLKGKKMEREGKMKVKEAKALKENKGNRKLVRQLRREGRHLQKEGQQLTKKSRLLRKGKISTRTASRHGHRW